MTTTNSRRRFLLQTAVGTGMLADAAGVIRLLRPVGADEVRLPGGAVTFTPEIEPLVRLIEDTSRDELIETIARRIRNGASYQELVAALFLAGVRNVQPRPSVGFKFHAVLVVNSAHLASLASPPSDRWLPILWALDNFKSSQARDVREGNWTMSAVDESAVPKPTDAPQALRDAMDSWDEDRADAAVAGLTRSAGAAALLELFAHYGVRDFRSIGHKAIFVANAWRTLQCIGWQYAEPVMRSLAYALLNHEGEPNPGDSDLAPDRPYRQNQKLAAEIRADWLDGKPDPGATGQLIAALRTASAEDASRQVAEMLNAGVSPQSIYDGLFAVSGEWLMRQPGIVALHAMTTTNAMHYLYDTSNDDATRKLILLQNAAFLALFREAMQGRGRVGDLQITEIEPAQNVAVNDETVSNIFASMAESRAQACAQTLAYLNGGGDARTLIRAARQMVFLKGDDSHDYKFSSAVLEDFYQITPEMRNAFLAASMYNLRGGDDRDNPLSQRIRDALA